MRLHDAAESYSPCKCARHTQYNSSTNSHREHQYSDITTHVTNWCTVSGAAVLAINVVQLANNSTGCMHALALAVHSLCDILLSTSTTEPPNMLYSQQ
jgi:hypothetical protein